MKKQDANYADVMLATPKGDIEIKSVNEELKDEIESEFYCAICIVIMTEATTAIPCMHNFCKMCIEKWMKNS